MNALNFFEHADTQQRLQSMAQSAKGDAHQLARHLIERCAALPEAEKRHYDAPILLGRRLVDEHLKQMAGSERVSVCRALIAAAGLLLPKTFEKQELPASVASLFPAAVSRTVATLYDADAKDYTEESDLYRKDLRMVVGHAVPAGAQDVDLFAALPWTSVVKNPSWQTVSRYFAAEGAKTWFRIHTDPRDTSEFTEEGWRRCYHRIADLLRSRPDVKGMVGTSWFYDPQLLTISPRLAYLQKDPLDGGAFMLRNGPGEIHTQRATLTSPSRRKLFEEGKYLPTCWTVAWPRKELLAWAATAASGESK